MKLDPTTSALLVVDIQERLAAAMPRSEGESAIENAHRLLMGSRALGLPVFVSEQYPKGLGSTVGVLRDADVEMTVLEKIEFDALSNEGIRAALEASGRKQLIVCGMESHICVYQTARGAVDLGYEVHVAGDATCSRAASNRRVAERLWERAGANVSGTETVLFDLLGKAGSDAFKLISKLVR